jgi:hypothetical protein
VDVVQQIEEFYAKVDLVGIARDIGFSENELQEKFAQRVRYAGKRYIELIKANPERSTPGKQAAVLTDYAKSLRNLKVRYKKLHKDESASTRFYKALRDDYESNSDFMKQMLAPYIDAQGFVASAFDEMLDVLIQASDRAQTTELTYDKADLSREFLDAWILAIRSIWPTTPAVTFGLGDYIPEMGGFKSSCVDVLIRILPPVIPEFDETYLGNRIKVLNKDKSKQPPAFFVWIS